MTNNIMLDFESMGLSNKAAIISIGAVRFDKEVVEKFYEIVDLQSSIDAGLVIDAGTVLWWMKQSDDARKQLDMIGHDLKSCLKKLTQWMGKDPVIWGNGPRFDNAILANAYENLGMPLPWKHYNDRCYKTIRGEYPEIKIKRIGTFHNAVDDAESQANHVIEIRKHMHRNDSNDKKQTINIQQKGDCEISQKELLKSIAKTMDEVKMNVTQQARRGGASISKNVEFTSAELKSIHVPGSFSDSDMHGSYIQAPGQPECVFIPDGKKDDS